MPQKRKSHLDDSIVNHSRRVVCAGCGKYFFPKGTTIILFCTNTCRRRVDINNFTQYNTRELHTLGS